MLNSLKIIVVTAILMLGGKAYSATGCIYSSGYIYYSRDGNDSGYPNYAYMPRTLSSSVYCVVTSSSWCRIDNAVWGNIVTFSTVDNCPVDDEVWVLLVVAGGASFYLIRKQVWLNSLIPGKNGV